LRKEKGDFSDISVGTEGFVEQEEVGQFGARCASRKTYFMSDRTHIFKPMYF